jgi:hypothetical protein
MNNVILDLFFSVWCWIIAWLSVEYSVQGLGLMTLAIQGIYNIESILLRNSRDR